MGDPEVSLILKRIISSKPPKNVSVLLNTTNTVVQIFDRRRILGCENNQQINKLLNLSFQGTSSIAIDQGSDDTLKISVPMDSDTQSPMKFSIECSTYNENKNDTCINANQNILSIENATTEKRFQEKSTPEGDDYLLKNEDENSTLQSEPNHVFENEDTCMKTLAGTEKSSQEISIPGEDDCFFMSEDETLTFQIEPNPVFENTVIDWIQPNIPIVDCNYDEQSSYNLKNARSNNGGFQAPKDVDGFSNKNIVLNSSRLTLTRNRLKLRKKMERISGNLKEAKVVLEKLDIRPSYSASEILKKQNKNTTVENETPLIEKVATKLKDHDLPINEKNKPSIDEDIEISIDEKPLIDDNSNELISETVHSVNSKVLKVELEGPDISPFEILKKENRDIKVENIQTREDKLPPVDTEQDLLITEKNKSSIVENIEIPIDEKPLIMDDNAREDGLPPIDTARQDLPITEKNKSSIDEDIEIPIDERPFIVDDNAIEDELLPIDIVQDLPITERNRSLIDEDIEIPIDERPLIVDDNAVEDEPPPIDIAQDLPITERNRSLIVNDIEIPIDEIPLIIIVDDYAIEDELPRIDTAQDLPITEKNKSSIDEDIEIPIDERLLIVDDNAIEDEPLPIDTAQDLPITERNRSSRVEDIEIPVGERPLIMDDNANKLISQILHWNSSDFKEAWKRGKRIPAFLQKVKADKNSQSYESYQEYRKKLTSQLTLDVAHKITNAITDTDKTSTLRKIEVLPTTAMKIMLTGTSSYFLGFDIKITVSSSSSSQVPLIGNLLCLEMFNANFNLSTMIFAYTRDVKIVKMENNSIAIFCNLMTKWLNLNNYSSEIMDLQVLMSLLEPLNMLQSVTDFESSPILPLILKPEEETYKLSTIIKSTLEQPVNSSNSQFNIFEEHVKSKQFHSVLKITKTIFSQNPKVCLIEGPPGTGKTKTIIDVIFSVLLSKIDDNWPLRILVCSQSKKVVDEILRRSSKIDIRGDIRMVHTSGRSETDPQINEFSLPFLAKQHVSFEISEFLLSQKIENKEEVNSPLDRTHELKYANKAIKKYVFETCCKIQQSGKSVQEMDEEDFAKLMDFAQKVLLLEADIIFSTLSMCHSDKMNALFRKKERISVCIIDDATKIPEIEILKPLTFGPKMLILLGDPFLSNYNLTTPGTNNSLFSRIKINFEGIENSPVIKYDLQYRLNQTVMFCLNEILFSGNVDSYFRENTSPAIPSTVFNLKSNYTEEDEALFVANLITSIIEFANLTHIIMPVSIGIIVPFAIQKPGIISAINASLENIAPEKRQYFSIDVDTISGFKNQERDVIIVSCTKIIKNRKRPVGDEWFYSAITRSRHSLMLYGSFETMEPCLLQYVLENFVQSQNIKINFVD